MIPVLGSQPSGDVSHKPDSRLPLLSTRPAVTFATLKRAATNSAAWWTEARWVWTVCLRTQALQHLSPACYQATKKLQYAFIMINYTGYTAVKIRIRQHADLQTFLLHSNFGDCVKQLFCGVWNCWKSATSDLICIKQIAITMTNKTQRHSWHSLTYKCSQHTQCIFGSNHLSDTQQLSLISGFSCIHIWTALKDEIWIR